VLRSIAVVVEKAWVNEGEQFVRIGAPQHNVGQSDAGFLALIIDYGPSYQG
jgi:hypothetical protein